MADGRLGGLHGAAALLADLRRPAAFYEAGPVVAVPESQRPRDLAGPLRCPGGGPARGLDGQRDSGANRASSIRARYDRREQWAHPLPDGRAPVELQLDRRATAHLGLLRVGVMAGDAL